MHILADAEVMEKFGSCKGREQGKLMVTMTHLAAVFRAWLCRFYQRCIRNVAVMTGLRGSLDGAAPRYQMRWDTYRDTCSAHYEPGDARSTAAE